LPPLKGLKAGVLETPGPLAAAAAPPGARLVREIGRDLPLRQPLLLALDPEGRTVVLDRPAADYFRLSRLAPGGEAVDAGVVFARGPADTELLEPASLAVDAQHALYVCDAFQGCIQKFSADGRWLATFREAGPAGSRFRGPRGVYVSRDGHVVVADTNNSRVVRLLPDGELLWVVERFAASPGGPEEEEFYEPCSVSGDGGETIWVADAARNRVLAFDGRGHLRTLLGGNDLFAFPTAVRAGAGGTALYVADQFGRRVQRFDGRGTRTGTLLLPGQEAGVGGDLAVDADGQVVMIDPSREAIVVLAFQEP
jgi:tripartite motif-containing protein 71